jgi:formamidopyrimidine-DNA glycosylase
MPELPDVECFKSYFQRTSLNKKIVKIEAPAKELIKKCKFEDFQRKLVGKKFKRVWRRGKFMIVEIEGLPEKLIFHFGMTGDLKYRRKDAPRTGEDRFSRLIFRFENGWELRWINIRKFGKVWLLKDPTEIPLIKKMGPEPLEFKKEEFLRLLKLHSQKNLKAFLLDQKDIAGIGNIYSDEILFQAKISPHRKIESLSKKEKEILFKKMRSVLKKAVPLLWTEFPKSWLIWHREDKICPQNKNHHLIREIIAGRAAIWCPKCQK